MGIFKKKTNEFDLKNIKKPIICAFQAELKDVAMGSFQGGVVLTSSERLKAKIRSGMNVKGGEVLFIPPSEWNPPVFSSTSQVKKFFPTIMKKVAKFLAKNGRQDILVQSLIAQVQVLPLPMIGWMFFIYKIPPK